MENLKEEYIYERLSKDNLKDLLYLIKDCYNREDSIERLKKKYNTKAWGAEYVGYLAYSNETKEPAAYYGVFPISFSYKGETLLAAQSGDTMTHSNHRRKGLFTKLAKVCYTLAQNEGIKFVFGFPVDASFPGFKKKLDWKFHEKINAYDFLVFTIPIAEILKRTNATFFKSYLKFVKRFFKKNQVSSVNITNSVLKEGMAGIKRDDDYLLYKNDESKFFVQKNSATAWIKIDGTIAIGDIFYENEKDVYKLITKLKWIAFLLGISRVRAYFSPNTKIDSLLKKIKAPREGINVGYLDFESGIPIEKMKFAFADFDTF